MSVGVGCNGSLGCCCCCEGIHRTESNTSEKECAAECQCKAQSERATERERNSLSFDCALSGVRSLLFTLSTVHSLSLLLWRSLGTSLSVVCVGIYTLWNETHHNHAPLGQLSPLGAANRGSAGSAAAAACPKMKSARIFLLYFKLLMSGLFSY